MRGSSDLAKASNWHVARIARTSGRMSLPAAASLNSFYKAIHDFYSDLLVGPCGQSVFHDAKRWGKRSIS